MPTSSSFFSCHLVTLAALALSLSLGGCAGCDPDPPGDDDGGGPAADAGGGDGDGGQVDDAGAGGDDAGPDGGPTEPIRDPNPNDPNNAQLDSDCDGISDLEEFTATYADGLRTDPADWDSDDDGVADGVEAGRTETIDAECPSTWADADPSTTTNPTVADTDKDCIPDGLEDKNRNGRVDPGETNPNRQDSDGDGLSDGEGGEDEDCSGGVDPGETNPAAADSDGDGLNDGVEIGMGTDPLNPDSSGDGVCDGANTVAGVCVGRTSGDPDDPLLPVPDSDGDGLRDELELQIGTDPNDADSDGDGLCDGPNTVAGVCVDGEDKNRNGIIDPGETDPGDADTDCDALSDGDEVLVHNTNPRSRDTDGDLVHDGVEVGQSAAVSGSTCTSPSLDQDPSTTTDPLDVDTDADGLRDGLEDRNRDGKLDPPPGDPQIDAQETDPTDPDSDDDNLCDGPADLGPAICVSGEDLNMNGRVDGNETDPNLPDVDTDGDGITDPLELNYCGTYGGNLRCLDPQDPDTDSDDLSDGQEVYTHGTNPLSPDTDCDGVTDGDEVNIHGTNPLLFDSDGDGLSDGIEVGATQDVDSERCGDIFVADQDPAVTTDPLDPDSDGDGVLDGAEDGNQNGRVDPGELDPGDPADAAPGGPVANACADPILPNLHQQQAADAILATHPDFPLQNASIIRQNGQVVGLTVVDTANEMVAFAIRKTPETAGPLDELTAISGRIGSLTVPVTQGFTAWDGYPAGRGTFTCAGGCLDGGDPNLGTRASRMVRRILGAAANDAAAVEAAFQNAPAITGDVKLGLEVVRRSPATTIVVGAVTALGPFEDPLAGRDFRLEDLYGGTALAQVGDTIGTECDRFDGQADQKVDFIWVVDDSGSMAAQQAAVSAAATAMAAQLTNSTLDWRIAVVTTYYHAQQTGSGSGRTYCDFMTTAATFQSCIDDVVASGRGDERGWQSLQQIFADRWLPVAAGSDSRVRPDARVAVIALADSGDQSREADGGGDRVARDVTGWTTWAQGGTGQYTWDPNRADEQPLLLNGILCPFSAANGAGCSGEADSTQVGGTNYSLDVYHDVVANLGGVVGSISVPDGSGSAPAAEIGATIEAIMNVVVGTVTPYELSDDPISATLKVAMGASAPGVGACPDLADVPRSRANGFSYDAATNQLAFWGSCRPEEATQIAVSYRTWIDLTGDPDGGDQPCDGECTPPLVCINDQCVCPSDCGGTLGPGQTCNPATCEPECLDDCGGACGGGQVCDTASCACECPEDCNGAQPDPSFVCDPGTCQWSCPIDGCDAATKPAGDNWVCGASCDWECPDDCGSELSPTERCNRSTCEVECASDCNATCGGYESCNTDTCACECVESATCAAGFVFDSDACGCVCDADALGCPATHTPNLDSCSCSCGPDCNDACPAGTICAENTCGCLPVGG